MPENISEARMGGTIMSEYSGNREVYERFLDAAAELVMDQYAVSVAEA